MVNSVTSIDKGLCFVMDVLLSLSIMPNISLGHHLSCMLGYAKTWTLHAQFYE